MGQYSWLALVDYPSNRLANVADLVVNSGLGLIRGARMAENRPSKVTGTQQQRLSDPLVLRNGVWQPTSWNDALACPTSAPTGQA